MYVSMTEKMKTEVLGREWRHHVRYPFDQWMDYRHMERTSFGPCYCENISLGGAKIVVQEPLEFGQLLLLHFEFSLKDSPYHFEVIAMVVRIHSTHQVQSNKGFRVGVQFLIAGSEAGRIQILIQAIADGQTLIIRAASLPFKAV